MDNAFLLERSLVGNKDQSESTFSNLLHQLVWTNHCSESLPGERVIRVKNRLSISVGAKCF